MKKQDEQKTNKKQKEMKGFAFVNQQAKRDFLALPEDMLDAFGSDINAVQQGLRPYSQFEDLSNTIGAGVIELKQNGSPAFRVVYCAKYQNIVYVLAAFTKTTNGVDRPAMRTVAERYKEMMASIRREGG